MIRLLESVDQLLVTDRRLFERMPPCGFVGEVGEQDGIARAGGYPSVRDGSRPRVGRDDL